MSFWCTKTFKSNGQSVVSDFSSDYLHHGAYELAIGPEIYLTSSSDDTEPKKDLLSPGQTFVIPAGQFALLLTEETVTIPNNAIGFISMRFTVKRRGLINVSGFHVDSGYSNRLKFSVYNAGPSAVTLHRGKRIFMLWLSELDEPTDDVYKGQSPNHDTITDEDQDIIRGKVSSPSQLRKELEELKNKESQDIEKLRHEIGEGVKYKILWIGLLIAILTRSLFSPWHPFSLTFKPSVEQLRQIEDDVTKSVTERLAAEQTRNTATSETVTIAGPGPTPPTSNETNPVTAGEGEPQSSSATPQQARDQPTAANPNGSPESRPSPTNSNKRPDSR